MSHIRGLKVYLLYYSFTRCMIIVKHLCQEPKNLFYYSKIIIMFKTFFAINTFQKLCLGVLKCSKRFQNGVPLTFLGICFYHNIIIIWIQTILLRSFWCAKLNLTWIRFLIAETHNAPVSYYTIHHFCNKLCTFLLQNDALLDIWLMHCWICEMSSLTKLAVEIH